MASRSELLAEIERLASMNGTVPRLQDMNESGKFSERPYWDEFGSWSEAIEAADIDVPDTRGQTYTDGELLGDLQSVAGDSQSVTQAEYRERGEYSTGTFEDRFGTWNAALRAAGLSVNRRSAVEVECDQCGKTFERPKCHLERDWTTHTFCSETCHGNWREGRIVGPEHPQFNPNSHDEYGVNWEECRSRAIQRDGGKCVRCGVSHDKHREQTGRDLHVHHIVPRTEFDDMKRANRLSNLVTLCAPCHTDIEHNSGVIEA
ncbi:homing endonuclease associated repeat-containing protein [Haloarcula argentinensis]|uniref:HNH endonuclease n=1 Tax=Haloarcula argentinensis TaxID=43776 RepID=A0A830FWL0_HALAR|nr:HNH endonuclease [Haloarcula argentinensis]GGM52535.1 hypothetical protein GCM10009006_37080 [Haloarcula argentinensis]